MLALLAAGAIATQPTSVVRMGLDHMPVVRQVMACGVWRAVPTAQLNARPQARRLGDLPKANWEIAVLKLDADGCQQPVVVSYGVEGGGKAAPGK